MPMTTPSHWLALSAVEGVGPKTFKRLIDEFGDPLEAMQASTADLTAIPRIDAATATAIQRAADDLERVDAQLLALEDEGVEVLTLDHDRYPSNLRTVAAAPPLLYVRGGLREGDALAAAIIGSRAASAEAVEAARRLAAGLAERGVTIVSGLAEGVDTAAHVGALDAGGRTIGVLGSGIRVVHPRRNAELAENMTAHGAVCSELSPNAPPSAANLMARDRIVSGMCRAIIVVHAAEKSGTMDTVRRGRKQGRTCLTVDWGAGHPECSGNRVLLKLGAQGLRAEEAWDFDALAETIENASVADPDAGKPKQLPLFE